MHFSEFWVFNFEASIQKWWVFNDLEFKFSVNVKSFQFFAPKESYSPPSLSWVLYWVGVQVDTGLNSWNPQKTHLRPMVNLYTPFQSPRLNFNAIIRAINSKNEKKRPKTTILSLWGGAMSLKCRYPKSTFRIPTTSTSLIAAQFGGEVCEEQSNKHKK